MNGYIFDCECGLSRMRANQVRPDCPECGKKMTISEKVRGSVSHERIDSYNRIHGTTSRLAGDHTQQSKVCSATNTPPIRAGVPGPAAGNWPSGFT